MLWKFILIKAITSCVFDNSYTKISNNAPRIIRYITNGKKVNLFATFTNNLNTKYDTIADNAKAVAYIYNIENCFV